MPPITLSRPDNDDVIARPASLVRGARLKADLTQRALSKRSGIPQPTIAAIESGDRDARYLTLERILKACGFELDLVRLPDIPVDREAIRRHLRLSQADRWKALSEARRYLIPFPTNDEVKLAELYALRDELEAAERARRPKAIRKARVRGTSRRRR